MKAGQDRDVQVGQARKEETRTKTPGMHAMPDNRKLNQKSMDKNTTATMDQETRQEPEDPQKISIDNPTKEVCEVYFGLEQKTHQLTGNTRSLDKEREEKIERAEKNEKSWELLREWTKFLNE